MTIPNESLLFMVVGPGGSGKTILIERLLAADKTLWTPTAWTTRPRRKGEPEDAYVFVSRPEFLERVEEGGFLEHVEFGGNLYGTPIVAYPPAGNMLKIFELAGARQIKARLPQSAKMILLLAPTVGILAQRLRDRGDSEEAIADRISMGIMEERAERPMADVVIINHAIDLTVATAMDAIAWWRRGQR